MANRAGGRVVEKISARPSHLEDIPGFTSKIRYFCAEILFCAKPLTGDGMERGRRSVLRHSGLAQAGEIGLLEQCANLR